MRPQIFDTCKMLQTFVMSHSILESVEYSLSRVLFISADGCEANKNTKLEINVTFGSSSMLETYLIMLQEVFFGR